MSKFTRLARLQQRERVAALRLQGYLQSQIGEELGMSQPQVSRVLASLEAEWQERVSQTTAELKGRELAKLELLEREAWAQWHRSKQDAIKLLAEKTTGRKDGPASKSSKTTEHQCGDPQYLKIVLGAVSERCRIVGMHAPTKHTHTDPTGQEERPPALWIVPPEMGLDEWQKAAAALVQRP